MGQVVVTGAAGFIGCHLVNRLRRDGHAVTGIDRCARMPAGVEPLIADVTAGDERVSTALREAEAVFHLAGCPGVRTAAPDIAHRRWRDNVASTIRVLDAVPDDVPVVVASSSSVYGGAVRSAAGRLQPSGEDDPLLPRGGYARSKAALERVCAERAARGGCVAVARLFTVGGAGQRPDMAMTRWLAAVRAGRPVQVFGSTARCRDVTDVRDVVDGLARLAERQVCATVNLGTGQPHSLAEILDAVGAAVGRTPVVRVVPAGDEEPEATLADTRRCERLLGAVPRTDLSELVRWQAAAVAEPRSAA